MLKDLKSVLLPPYEPKDLYSIFVTAFIVFSIPITVILLILAPNNSSEVQNNSDEAQVKIIGLQSNKLIRNLETINIEASSDSFFVKSVELNVDGAQIVTVNNPTNSNRFFTSVYLDSTKFKNGEKEVVASALISNGLQVDSEPIIVAISNEDTQPPTVNLLGINDGAYISEETLEININAQDNMGVSEVKLYLDGQLLKEFSEPSYNYLLQTSSITSGSHNISADVMDLVGNIQKAEVVFYKAISPNAEF